MSLIIENNNRHEHNGNGITIDQIVSRCESKGIALMVARHEPWFRFVNYETVSFVDHDK